MYWKSVHFKLWCILSTAFLARKAKKYYDSTHLSLSSCERNATGRWEGGEQVLTLIHGLWEYQNICNKSSCMAHSIHWVSWHLCDKEIFALQFINWHRRSLSWFFLKFFISYSTLFLFFLLLGEISAAFMEDCGTIHNCLSSSWNIYSDKAVKLKYRNFF